MARVAASSGTSGWLSAAMSCAFTPWIWWPFRSVAPVEPWTCAAGAALPAAGAAMAAVAPWVCPPPLPSAIAGLKPKLESAATTIAITPAMAQPADRRIRLRAIPPQMTSSPSPMASASNAAHSASANPIDSGVPSVPIAMPTVRDTIHTKITAKLNTIITWMERRAGPSTRSAASMT